MSRVKKYILGLLILVIIFVISVVVFVERDQEGKLKFSLTGSQTNIISDNFNEVIQQELTLDDINWSDAYNKVLKQKYSKDNLNQKEIEISSGASKISEEEAEMDEDNKEIIFQKFVNYLNNSETKLDENKNPFQLALNYRDEGRPEKIDGLISFYDSKVTSLEKVTPPEEVLGYHLVKLRLLREIKLAVSKIKTSSQEMPLKEVLSEEEINYLARLDLILKQYLVYFFHDRTKA
jgi:hypothetical protein